ncbi:hypothetical protein GCM10012285_61310 [Streptomyces kronopolitis]|uniref:Uncharacterized protein n=1 Tax=Streptomyces kronopolitis TaxID=1612435 RepID=A0ABQ2K2A0_9ACTN|nr:hypothetical protein [Streptomyces kronopolitis]GGN61844.1 hypothetical protein GCM10012285_61310 [Streptomyces kronopolitis]
MFVSRQGLAQSTYPEHINASVILPDETQPVTMAGWTVTTWYRDATLGGRPLYRRTIAQAFTDAAGEVRHYREW